jgi:hypothetical protein
MPMTISVSVGNMDQRIASPLYARPGGRVRIVVAMASTPFAPQGHSAARLPEQLRSKLAFVELYKSAVMV